MSNNIVAVPGVWQLVTATSSLIQEGECDSNNILLLYGYRLSSRMIKSMESISKELDVYTRKIWISEEGPSRPINLDILDGVKCLPSRADKVFICRSYSNATKSMIEKFDKSEVIIYEDGLGNYENVKAYRPEIHFASIMAGLRTLISKILKNEKRHSLIKYSSVYRKGVCKRHLNRIKRVYLNFCDILETPDHIDKKKVTKIREGILNGVIDKISDLVKLNDVNNEKSYHMILGSGMTVYGDASYEEELYQYKKLINSLPDGARILWKGHPRTWYNFGDNLKEYYEGSFVNFSGHKSTPAEILFKEIDIIRCFSMSSTSIFTAKFIFDIDSFLFSEEFVRKYNRAVQVYELINNHISYWDIRR